MRKAAESRRIVGCLIATTINLGAILDRDDAAPNRFEETLPSRVPSSWHFLGYDVADQWLVSGLSNCGYIEDEREEWRLKWSRRINNLHLLLDVDDAHEFAQATNQRVAEHAPFYVYGLWKETVH
jgi:hypothetical protein